MSEEIQVTEQSLREALERLGSKSDKKSFHKPEQVSDPNNARPFYTGGNAHTNVPSGKKRRFINDGGVVVEHRKDIGRHNRKVGMVGKGTIERSENGDLQEEVQQLQRSLAHEQQRSLAAETELEGLKEKIRSLETRLAHYQFQLDEREKKLTLLKEDNVKLKLREGRKIPNVVETSVSKRKIKTMTHALSNENSEEQQPVKWWSGD